MKLNITEILASIIIGILAGAFALYFVDIGLALVISVLLGFLFFISIKIFLFIKKESNTIHKQGADHTILMVGHANYIDPSSSIGGTLILTSGRLIFEPHKMNFKRTLIDIDLVKIEGLSFFNSLNIFPNGLSVISEDNVYNFVVNNRRKWKEKITHII